MGLIPFFGLPRRIKRMAFLLFVVALVYAGPRFMRDMVNEARPGPPTTTTTVLLLP